MTTATTKLLTADELLAMGDIGRCELIYGELVMMSPAGGKHGMIAAKFARFLDEWVDHRHLGVVLGAETGFKIASKPDLVRAPDASFVAGQRPIGEMPDGYIPGVPDLAVEVVSPDDTRREVAEKVNMWLAHGTQVVWVADPQSQTVVIHRVGEPAVVLQQTDTLRDEPLLPGLELPLSRIFV